MKHITKSGMKKVAIVSVVAIIMVLLAYQFSPAGIQRRNISHAKAHIVKHGSQILDQSRYHDVIITFGYDHDGCIRISGFVTDEQSLVDLKNIWDRTSPPVETYFFVRVDGPAETKSP